LLLAVRPMKTKIELKCFQNLRDFKCIRTVISPGRNEQSKTIIDPSALFSGHENILHVMRYVKF